MFVMIWLPVALLGAVFVAVCVVSGCVERVVRRRARLVAVLSSRPRRGFRPVVIQGGRQEAPAEIETEIEKMTG